MSFFTPRVARLCLQAPTRFFVCNQCLRVAPQKSAPKLLNSIPSRTFASAKTVTPPLGSSIVEQASSVKAQAKRTFPQTSSKSVAYWLLGSAASVFGIVVFGGLTRLTESGYARKQSAQLQRQN